MPVRIQRKRTKGWRMPPNTVYVGRPGIYGNPFTVWMHPPDIRTPQLIVDDFREWWDGRGWLSGTLFFPDRMGWLMGAMFQTQPHPLRGKDLACWCPLDQPCHADVLLEIANSEGG